MQTHDWLYEKQEGNPETEREKKQKKNSAGKKIQPKKEKKRLHKDSLLGEFHNTKAQDQMIKTPE